MITAEIPKKLLLITVVAALTSGSSMAAAQVAVIPGESVQGEFVSKRQEQVYSVNMIPGDVLRLHIRSVGETLLTAFEIKDPGGETVKRWKSAGRLEHDFSTPVLSARGKYTIMVLNTRGVGAYRLLLGLRQTAHNPAGLQSSLIRRRESVSRPPTKL